MWFFLAILSFALIGTQVSSESDSLIQNEWAQAISPDSERLVTLQTIDSVDVLRVRISRTHALLFSRELCNTRVDCLEWLTDSTLIVSYRDSTLAELNVLSGVEQKITALNGIRPHAMSVDYTRKRLILAPLGRQLAEVEQYESEIIIYDLRTGNIKKYSFVLDIGWLFDIIAWKDDSLLANHGGFLSIISLKDGVLTEIERSDGSKMMIDESSLNLVRDAETVLLSLESGGLALVDLTTRVTYPLAGYEDFAYPLLAPNGEFLYANNLKPPYDRKRIDDFSIQRR